jgi:integrase
MSQLVPKPATATATTVASTIRVPTAIASAGDRAARRFLEFFAATIRNKNTRIAYYRASCSFFAWLEQRGVAELVDIEPLHVAAYAEALQETAAKPTVKQHLAAVRMLFDWLVVGQLLAVNPAHAVRGPKYVVRRGKTPVLSEEQARRLIESIDTSTLVSLRDRALIGVMTYAFARIGAVVAMRVEDYYPNGKRWWVRLNEKGGKPRNAGASQARSLPRQISRRCRYPRRWQRPPLPQHARQNRRTERRADAPHRRLLDDPPPRGRSRLQAETRLPRVPCRRDHCLS